MNLLLVEDDLFTAHNICTAVEDHGYRCDVAASTSEAMELLRQVTYDAAILDHYLQGETSLFLTSHLRLRHPETKIITITGSALFASGYGMDRLGSDFLLRKPFRSSDLIAIVKYLQDTSVPMAAPAGPQDRSVAL